MRGLITYFELLEALLKACPGVFCRQQDLVELLGEVHARFSIFKEKDPEHLEFKLQKVADIIRNRLKAP